MADLSVSIVLKMINRLSQPGRQAVASLRDIHKASKEAASGFRSFTEHTERFEQRLGAFASARKAESDWVQFQNVAGVTDERLARIIAQVNALQGARTGQSSAALSGGLETLVGLAFPEC